MDETNPVIPPRPKKSRSNSSQSSSIPLVPPRPGSSSNSSALNSESVDTTDNEGDGDKTPGNSNTKVSFKDDVQSDSSETSSFDDDQITVLQEAEDTLAREVPVIPRRPKKTADPITDLEKELALGEEKKDNGEGSSPNIENHEVHGDEEERNVATKAEIPEQIVAEDTTTNSPLSSEYSKNDAVVELHDIKVPEIEQEPIELEKEAPVKVEEEAPVKLEEEAPVKVEEEEPVKVEEEEPVKVEEEEPVKGEANEPLVKGEEELLIKEEDPQVEDEKKEAPTIGAREREKPEPSTPEGLTAVEQLNSKEVAEPTNQIPLIPSRPKPKPKPLARADSDSSSSDTPKQPPPKPKKLSSKIAAFQEMLNQRPKTPEIAPKEPARGKLSTNHMKFAQGLQGIMGRGVALPGMVDPARLKKLQSEDEEESNDLKEEEEEERKEEVSKPTSVRRAKGPRGKKLPKNLSQPSKLEQESRFEIVEHNLWSLKFKKQEESKEDESVMEENKENFEPPESFKENISEPETDVQQDDAKEAIIKEGEVQSESGSPVKAPSVDPIATESKNPLETDSVETGPAIVRSGDAVIQSAEEEENEVPVQEKEQEKESSVQDDEPERPVEEVLEEEKSDISSEEVQDKIIASDDATSLEATLH